MSHGQAGFLIGFLIAVLLWAAGFWVTVGAVAAGLLGFAAVRIVDGDLDVSELSDRWSSDSQS